MSQRELIESLTRDNDANLYSINEVAAILRVSSRTVYRWIQLGLLQSYKFCGKYKVYSEDLSCFIKQAKLKKPSN